MDIEVKERLRQTIFEISSTICEGEEKSEKQKSYRNLLVVQIY